MTTDLRYAVRMLVKHRGFTAVAVLSLALGIGANATVFCWIQNVLLRPLPGVANPDRLVVLASTHGSMTMDTVSLPDLEDYAQLTNTFSGVIGSQITPACLTLDGELQWVFGQIVTANFFDLLGVKPILGRTFVREEGQKPGGNPVMVLSEGCWRRSFGADPGIVGRTVALNRHSFTIIGVLPSVSRGTMSGLTFDFWAPLSMHEEVANFGSLTQRGDRWLHTQARLRPGVRRAQAQAAVTVLGAQLEDTYPDSNREMRAVVLPLWKSPYGVQPLMLPVLQILLAVSLGVLLIVSANIANLLLAKSVTRQKEIAIRSAMGARFTHLVRQLLTESVLLALLGGAMGVIVAFWATHLFAAFVPNTHLPIALTFVMDRETLVYTVIVSLVTGLVFGLAPAIQSGRMNLNTTLREGGRTSHAGSVHHRLRGGLVVAEIALALVLLVGAGLCIKGFDRARRTNIGIDPRNMLIAGLRIGMNGYTEETGMAFYRQIRERLEAVPGVGSVALASWFPLGFEGGSSLGVDVEGYSRRPNEDLGVPYSIISPGYFETMGIPLLDGRDFSERDDANSAGAAIINETMANRFWQGQNPIGRKFKIWRGEKTVVGIAKNGKYRSLNELPKPFFYLPYQQGVWDLNLGIAIRATGDPASIASAVRRDIHALDPGVAVWASLPMIDFIQAAFFAQRVASILLLVLGAISLILAAIGIYGVMAYVVSQRTHELGIRMALGAQSSDIRRLVVGHGMTLAVIGVTIGLAGSLALTHFLTGFLFGVSPFDPATFLSVALVLAGVAFLACYIPARRATKVDPLVALRCE